MKRRRRKPSQEELDELTDLAGYLYRVFEINLERCERLTRARAGREGADAGRAEALQGAVELSGAARGAWAYVTQHTPLSETEDRLLPGMSLPAAARLTYGLIALAEEDPEPEARLAIEEINGLIAQYQLEPWIELWRTAHAEHGVDAYARPLPGAGGGAGR